MSELKSILQISVWCKSENKGSSGMIFEGGRTFPALFWVWQLFENWRRD